MCYFSCCEPVPNEKQLRGVQSGRGIPGGRCMNGYSQAWGIPGDGSIKGYSQGGKHLEAGACWGTVGERNTWRQEHKGV